MKECTLAADLEDTHRAIVRAASDAGQEDKLDLSPLAAVNFINSPAQTVNIHDVTFYATSSTSITRALLDAQRERADDDRREALFLRTRYRWVSAYIDAFRPVVGERIDDAVVLAMLAFLEDFSRKLETTSGPDWTEFIEVQTLIGTFERLYGQHLLLMDLKRRDEANEPFSTQFNLAHRRAGLVSSGADHGHFQKSAARLESALRLTREKLGEHDDHVVILLFERSALYRDRGEYPLALKMLRTLLTELYDHHSSEKRWIAAVFKSLGVVSREAHHHFRSSHFLWAASTYDESSGSQDLGTKNLIRLQRKFTAAYLGIRLLLALIVFPFSLIIPTSLTYRLLLTAAVSSAVHPIFLAFTEGLLALIVGAWVIGPSRSRWPVADPIAHMALTMAARDFARRSI